MYSKRVQGHYIETEENAIKLAELLGMWKVTFNYSSREQNAEGRLRGSSDGFYKPEGERKNPFASYEIVSIARGSGSLSNNDILKEKERLGLGKRKYFFTGVHGVFGGKVSRDGFWKDEFAIEISSNVSGTVASKTGIKDADKVAVESNFERFKRAMTELGFKDLQEFKEIT